MPIYEYQCDECGAEFEEIRSTTADAPPCPKCKSDKTRKLMSCCRYASGGGDAHAGRASAPAARSGCAGCSGGDCSSCG